MLAASHTGRLRFGSIELDLVRGRLLDGGAPVPIQPKPLALLAYLISHRHRVVSRDEVRSALWPGVHVSDAALASVVRDLRRSLGEAGESSRFIETLRGRGMRFVHPVEELDPAGRERSRSGLVGREHLLAVLVRQVEAAEKGSGQLVFLMGEAGIGKSRIAVELAARARERGLGVHLGRCLEEEGAPHFHPWIQVLRSTLGARSPSDLAAGLDSASLAWLEALLGRSPLDAPVSRAVGDTASSRFALFDSASRVLSSAAREHPALVILDDLHRADASSLLLLRRWVEEIADVPVMVLGTFRDDEVEASPALTEALRAIHPAGSRIRLSGLALDEVRELVSLTSGAEIPAGLAEIVHERTSGNPLFVEEVSRALAAEGAFASGAALERARACAPLGLRHMIGARVAEIPEAIRSVLEAAAVIGREFDALLLERVCSRLGDLAFALGPGLEAAVAARLIVAEGGSAGAHRFAHILVRDALYEGLRDERRALLHAAVGSALEEAPPHERDLRADALAHHFEKAVLAGEAARALRWARRAAERAIAQAAYDEAAARCTRALRIAAGWFGAAGSDAPDPSTPVRESGELLVLLGRARWSAGSTEVAREAFLQAADAARSIGSAEVLARAALGFTGRTDVTPGVNRQGVKLLEEALDALPVRDSALRAEVLARLGTELYHDPDPVRSQTLTTDALAMAERLGDPGLEAYVATARHFTLLQVSVEPRARLPLTERAIALTEGSGPKDVLALGLQERCLDLLEMGDGPRFDRTFAAYERVVDELRQPFFSWFRGLFRGLRAFLDGDVEAAERLAHETLEIGRSFGSPNALGAFSGQLFAVRREQGRLSELESPLRALLAQQPDLPVFRTALASVAAECGRREAAHDAVAHVLEHEIEEFPSDEHWLTAMTLLAPACVLSGEPVLVRRLYDLLVPFEDRVAVAGHGAACNGAVSHHLGRLAVALGDFDAADDHFAAARSLHRQLQARLWLAHTRREHAVALWKRGTPGDREQARALQAEALATYQALDLEHRIRQTRSIGVGG
jgi:DNA-binding winged helix-turn-helix (wHTH) protein/tetratricopeptide (TPR) repeat protein